MVAAATASVLWLFAPVEIWLGSAIEWLRASPGGGPLAFGVLYLVSALILIPSTLLTLAAGSIWGLWRGALILHVVSVFADLVAFLVARRFAEAPALTRLRQRYPRAAGALEGRDGFYLTCLLRWFPLAPYNVMNYLLGLTTVPTRTYLAATALATVPNTLVFVYLGTLITGEPAHPLGIGVGVSLGLISLLGLARYARDHLTEAPVPLRAETYHRLDAVPQAIWSQPDLDLFLTRPYLTAIVDTVPDVTLTLHALWDGDEPVAFTALQHADMAPQRSIARLANPQPGHSRRQEWVRRLVRAGLARTNTRTTVCGNVFVAEAAPHWTTRPDVAGPWLRAATEAADRDCAMLLLKDFRVAPAVDGYRAYDVDPLMVLTIQPGWRTAQDYVDSLRKKYRQAYRRARLRGAHVERRLLSAEQLTASAARIQDLYHQVLDAASFCPARYGPDTFAALQRLLPDRHSTVGYYLDGRLVAFNTRFHDGDALISHFFGVDRRVALDLDLYKNILYDDIEDAIATGCRQVHLGRASQEIKSGLGAEPAPSPSLIRHRRWWGQALRAPLSVFLRAPDWTPRHPFKTPHQTDEVRPHEPTENPAHRESAHQQPERVRALPR